MLVKWVAFVIHPVVTLFRVSRLHLHFLGSLIHRHAHKGLRLDGDDEVIQQLLDKACVNLFFI